MTIYLGKIHWGKGIAKTMGHWLLGLEQIPGGLKYHHEPLLE